MVASRTPDCQEILWRLRILWEDPGALYGGRGSLGVGMEGREAFYQVEMRRNIPGRRHKLKLADRQGPGGLGESLPC